MHYSWKVGLRYLRPKHRHFLISVLTTIAVVGVMFAVAAPEVTLSVMNGFEREVRQRIVNTNYHVFVLARSEFEEVNVVLENLHDVPGVESASPFVRREGVLSFSGGGSVTQRFRGCIIYGVDAEKEAQTTRVIQAVRPEFLGFDTDLLDEVDGRHYPGIVLGVELGREMFLSLGDVVTVASHRDAPERVEDLDEIEFAPRNFRVVGFLNSGFYEFDSQLVFVDLREAQDFLGFEERVTGIGVRVDNIGKADLVAAEIDAKLGPRYYTNHWKYMFRNIFTWMETERKLMRLLFGLITAIAMVTVVGMLTMIVLEKRKAIGILKGMGASNAGVMAIFMIHGTVIGGLGALFGNVLGWAVCQAVDRIGIELPGDVYIIDSLPVQMQSLDFVTVSAAALVICFVATLYPSWEAARLDPVESIRYE
ncbi:MAG: ABC transporter permease [Candidatus Latescibacterota bacterium]|nr:MAG: ABC transporter permease [Candidatus Latescibacterota bacterium]